MDEQTNWKLKEVQAQQAFVRFVQGQINKELGYEDWQASGLKEVYDYVDIPAGGWWIPYLTQDARGQLVGARVYNTEGLLVNQFEFVI
ncbi:MAG: hypothetical protein V1738_04985 [Patescibacteria group bacterium]